MSEDWFVFVWAVGIGFVVISLVTLWAAWKRSVAQRQIDEAQRNGLPPPDDAVAWTNKRVYLTILKWTAIVVLTLLIPLGVKWEVAGEFIAVASISLCVGFVLILLTRIAVQLWRNWPSRITRDALRLQTAGNIDGAIGLIRNEIGSRGFKAEYCNTLGCLLGEKGNWDEAIGLFEQAVRSEVRPNPLYIYNKGNALAKLGRANEALPVLLQAHQLDPINFLLSCQIATLLHGLNFVGDANQVYLQVVESRARHYLIGNVKVIDTRIAELQSLLSDKGALPRESNDGGKIN